MAQISSQIDALNRDYAASNLDKSKTPGVWAGLIVDSKIRFALATKDPQGKKTNGITNTVTRVTPDMIQIQPMSHFMGRGAAEIERGGCRSDGAKRSV